MVDIPVPEFFFQEVVEPLPLLMTESNSGARTGPVWFCGLVVVAWTHVREGDSFADQCGEYGIKLGNQLRSVQACRGIHHRAELVCYRAEAIGDLRDFIRGSHVRSYP